MTKKQKYDLYSADFRKHSHETFLEMRSSDPIFQQPGFDGETPIWFVTRYKDVEKVLLDDRHFSRDFTKFLTPEQYEELNTNRQAIGSLVDNHMLNKDGEDHRRLRSLVGKVFTPKMVQSLRPRIQQISDELLDGVQDFGAMDLIQDFAFPLPITVIGEMIGIPLDDRESFRIWSDAFVRPPLSEDDMQQQMALLMEFAGYLQKLVTTRTQDPQDDLLSALIHVEEAGDQLSREELFSMLALLIVAGHETTVNLIANSILALLQNPEYLEYLKLHPEAMPNAVEELLRYDSPVERALTRIVIENFELNGHQLRKGDYLIAVISSANRDEDEIENPTRLDFERESNPHLAFGKGTHYCLGAPLARLEGEIALNTLLRRLPNLQLAVSPDDLTYRAVPLFRALVRLPVKWSVP